MKEENSSLILDHIISLVKAFENTLKDDELFVIQSSVHQLGVEFGAGQYRLEGSCIGLACTNEADTLDKFLVQKAVDERKNRAPLPGVGFILLGFINNLLPGERLFAVPENFEDRFLGGS